MKSNLIRLVAVIAALLAIGIVAVGASAQESCSRFPETGKTVCGRFLSYWTNHGGLAQQGLPISDEFQEESELNGKTYTVQYFERAVFEYHPENNVANEVQLSQLGTFRYDAMYGKGQHSQPTMACTYCPAGYDIYHDDSAPTDAQPLNPDGVGDIVVDGPAMLDVEQTSDGHGGPSAPNGDGVHDFYVLVVPAGTSMMIKSYDVSHVRVWRFHGMPELTKALCHVWAEAERYRIEHKGNPNVKAKFMGQPMN